MDARKSRAEIEIFFRRCVGVRVVVIMRVVMIVGMVVVMFVIMVMMVVMVMIAMRMTVAMAVRLGFLRRLARLLVGILGRRSASANRAHYSTSSSLTRISSPPVICT